MRKSQLVLFGWVIMAVSLGSLIFNLPPERRKSVRELEKVSVKLIKQKCSLLFNSTCLKEDVLPTYSNIKLHKEAARKEPFTLKYRRRLVEHEVEDGKTNIPPTRASEVGP